MDEINHRLDECFDEDGKKVAVKYLNKCLTRFLKSNVKKYRKSLEESCTDKGHIDDLCTLRMLGFGLISEKKKPKS